MTDFKNKLILFTMAIMILLFSCGDDPVIGNYNSFDIIPKGLSASDGISDSAIFIIWHPVENAIGYNLKRTIDPIEEEYVLIAENIKDTSFIDYAINVGTRYFYKVNSIFESDDTSAYSSEELGFAGIDTVINDTFVIPEFIILRAEEGSNDTSVGLTWTNCGSDYIYQIYCAGYEDTAYAFLDSVYLDTSYRHNNVLPGPYTYRIIAISSKYSDTLTGTSVGYRLITNKEFFLEVNKTYTYSQKKVGKLTNKKLGEEIVGGDHHGILKYNSYLQGFNAKAILTYDNYKDFYLTLNGIQSTNIDGLFSQNGNVGDTVFVSGIYPGFIDHHIEVANGDPSEGYYTIGQPKDTSDIQFDEVKEFVLD